MCFQVPFYARSLPRGKPVIDPANATANQRDGKPVQPMYCPIILEQQQSSPRHRFRNNTDLNYTDQSERH